MSLPEERIPFPVESRYSVRPSMRRWGPDDHGHLRLDARYPEYLDAKLRLLRSDPGGCRVLAPDVDRAALRGALLRVAEGLASDAAPGRAQGRERGREQGAPAPGERGKAPDTPVLEGPAPILVEADAVRFPLLGIVLEGPGRDLVRRDPVASADALPQALRTRVREHLAGLEPLERLADALALAVQEDLVVMAGGAPYAVAPGAAAPGDAAPKDAAPEGRVREGRAPEDTAPAKTAPPKTVRPTNVSPRTGDPSCCTSASRARGTRRPGPAPVSSRCTLRCRTTAPCAPRPAGWCAPW